MDDLTEKVARALCRSRIARDCSADCEIGCKALESALVCSGRGVQAKAAIRAVLDGIREPDDAMKKAGKLAGDVDDLDHTPSETEAIFAAIGADEDGRPCIHVTWHYTDEVPNKALRGKQGGITCYPPETWGRGEWVAKTMDDAKQMACDFAEGVS